MAIGRHSSSGPPAPARDRHRRWMAAAVLAGAFVLAPLTAGAQTRSSGTTEQGASQQTVRTFASKKPKKMPQAKRDRIKAAKIKKAVEYETPPGGTEEQASATDYDALGNALTRSHRPGGNVVVDEEYTVDAVKDIITHAKSRSSIVTSAGGSPRTIEDVTESDYAYDEADFEDGKDYLLKSVEVKRGGVRLSKVDNEYDANGRLKRMVQGQATEENGPAANRCEVEFTYDTGEQPTEVVTFDTFSSSENPSGRRVISRQKRFYGANGQVSRIETWVPGLEMQPPGPERMTSFTEHLYDASLNLTSLKTYQRFPGEPDPVDVLVSEETHVYDSAGNETETIVSIPAPAEQADPSGPLPPSGRQAAQTRKTTRTFDTHGNVLTELTEEKVRGQVVGTRSKRIQYEKFE